MQTVARWNEDNATPSMVRPPNQPSRRRVVSRTLTVGVVARRQPKAMRITARYHSHVLMTQSDRWENGSNKDLLPVKKPVRRISVNGDIGSNLGKVYEENGFSCAMMRQPKALHKRSTFAAGA